VEHRRKIPTVLEKKKIWCINEIEYSIYQTVLFSIPVAEDGLEEQHTCVSIIKIIILSGVRSQRERSDIQIQRILWQYCNIITFDFMILLRITLRYYKAASARNNNNMLGCLVIELNETQTKTREDIRKKMRRIRQIDYIKVLFSTVYEKINNN